MNSDIKKEILDFRNERDWQKFHNPKDVAISIMLEAAELLEAFQWSGTDLYSKEKMKNIEEELADVFIYSILMADACNLDIDEIIKKKLKSNAEKYPVDKSFGTNKKYSELN